MPARGRGFRKAAIARKLMVKGLVRKAMMGALGGKARMRAPLMGGGRLMGGRGRGLRGGGRLMGGGGRLRGFR